jgi:hypothetical protein
LHEFVKEPRVPRLRYCYFDKVQNPDHSRKRHSLRPANAVVDLKTLSGPRVIWAKKMALDQKMGP